MILATVQRILGMNTKFVLPTPTSALPTPAARLARATVTKAILAYQRAEAGSAAKAVAAATVARAKLEERRLALRERLGTA